MAEKTAIEKSNPKYGMLQRMGFCLSGVGQNLGTSGLSQAKMLAPSAKDFLDSRNMSYKYEEEGEGGGGGGGKEQQREEEERTI